ncbi:MAG TPA: hypothetical protein VMU43_04050 [Candidatus Acidoferrum sp.]|nr:hypothetical protein [Candidatus Acidoferrum sp.]
MNTLPLFAFFRPLRSLVVVLLVLAVAPPAVYAGGGEEFDSYRLRVDAFWFYSNPSGSFQGTSEANSIDIGKDLNFISYSTFSGTVDWRFTRKNHFYVVGSSFDQTRQVVLQRTIVFQGQTFNVGLTAKGNLSAPLIAPGYQYDIIRRRRGHLGIAIQADLFNSHASISSEAQEVNGQAFPAMSARGSLLAPIPVIGPQFRFYLTNSPRLFVEGNVYGMYLFGYGNFVSTADSLGFSVNKHFSVNAGYQLGSRLVVNNDSSNNRIGVRLTQQGPVVGMEFSF